MSQKARKPVVGITNSQTIAHAPASAPASTRSTRYASATSDNKTTYGYYEQLAALSCGNLDAVLKANIALAEGLEAITDEALGYARQTLATAGAATEELLDARTLGRVIEINAGLVKSGIDALLGRTARLSELGIAIANCTLIPDRRSS